MTELWNYENRCWEAGYETVCGVDEAGRGPLAGPVCAAAVILPRGLDIPDLNDSKKLTAKRREALYDIITEQALAYGIAFASELEIDEINILQATFLATIVKGDSLSANIAAASILAKVTRDRFMLEMDEKYPQYGFATHKGYGTRAHYAALREFGPCPIHRRTFLKNLHAE